MRYKNFTCFLIGICLWACSLSIKDKEEKIVDLENWVEKSICFSSFVDSITYIPLETKEECLIGKIRDVILSDSIVFVLNGEQSEVLLFDNQGKYLRKISHVGNGPGEYTVINQMCYNKKRQSVSLASSKIIEYDVYSNLKREFSVPFYVSDLYQFDNGDYLLSHLERLEEPHSLVVLTDSTGKIKKDVLKRNMQYGVESTNYWELIPFGGEIHFISPQIENVLYSYKEDSLYRKLELKILPEVSSDFYKSKRGIPLLGNNYYRSLYRESDKWLNLVFCTTEKVRTLLYNKESDEYMVGEVFENDMDNREHLFFLSASDNNTFTNYVKPSHEEDNPVIQVLHLK